MTTKLREITPTVRVENGLVRINWRVTGLDGASVTESGAQEALTPYVAMHLAKSLITAVEAFQGEQTQVLDMRTG